MPCIRLSFDNSPCCGCVCFDNQIFLFFLKFGIVENTNFFFSFSFFSSTNFIFWSINFTHVNFRFKLKLCKCMCILSNINFSLLKSSPDFKCFLNNTWSYYINIITLLLQIIIHFDFNLMMQTMSLPLKK